jgi:hypothetical protein
MTPQLIKNLSHLTLGLALCTTLTACPSPEGPPPSNQKQNVAPQETYIEHTISYSGETLAEIAAWYTGRGSNWTAIRDANPSIRPDRLRLGQVILIPTNIVTNDKPFSRKASKKPKTEPTADANPTPASGDAAPATPTDAPNLTPTEAPALTPTDAPTPAATDAPAAPTSEPTLVPTPEPTAAPAVETPKPTSKDVEREKLLDELLK